MKLHSGRLNRLLKIMRPVPDNSIEGAGAGTWSEVAEVWAEVQDALPSRGERLDNGLNLSRRPARVRIRYRDDVTPDMRFVMGTRVMEIISGPAELGNRDGLEFMVEDFRSAGNGA